MVTVPNIPIGVWFLCSLFGFVVSVLLNQVSEKAKLKIPSQRLGYLFLLVSFLLLIWNTAFILRITAITAGAKEMNISDIQSLIWLSFGIEGLAYIVLGFVVGEIIFAFIQGIKNKRKEKAESETEVNISTKKLESTAKEIEKYRKARADLDGFFKTLSGRSKKESKIEATMKINPKSPKGKKSAK